LSELEASYYQRHRDDEDEWEEAPAPSVRRPKRRLDAIVSVRFSPGEQDILREAAGRRGETVSTFVRTAALRAARQAMPVVSITQATRATQSIVSGPLIVPRITSASIPSPLEPTTANGSIVRRTA
jgi:uncharacterized protein (DUF1778 family)